MLETKAKYKVEEMSNKELSDTAMTKLSLFQMMLMSGRNEDANECINQVWNCLDQIKKNS